MQRVSLGYTVVEVIIFLGISGALLVSSMAFLSGAEGHNRFSQSMRDTQSKFQDWLNDVPTGFASGTRTSTGITCQNSGGKLKFGTGGPTDTGDCIFLGKAIQITDDNSSNPGQSQKIFAYSIFGLRTFTPLSGDTRPVASLNEAGPIAAVGINPYSGSGGPGNVDLTEVYNIPGGAKVKKVLKSSAIAGDDSHLAGFYLSFNPMQSNASGSASLLSYQYNLPGNHDPGNVKTMTYKDVDECLSLTNAGSNDCRTPDNPTPLTDWEICFGNDTNSDTAILTLSSTGGLNVSTKLEFKPCP